jgi:hypothetical protein
MDLLLSERLFLPQQTPLVVEGLPGQDQRYLDRLQEFLIRTEKDMDAFLTRVEQAQVDLALLEADAEIPDATLLYNC